MKTFETEKHNIPEGATHYVNENNCAHFAWVKFVDGKIHAKVNDVFDWCHVVSGIDNKDVKPIPQTKDAEWVNGDECRYANDIEHEYIYIGEHPHGDGHYVFSEDRGITYIANGYLIEPETEAEKLERERLESAYDLYTHVQSVRSQLSCNFDWFSSQKMEETRLRFLAIVDKTNYHREN